MSDERRRILLTAIILLAAVSWVAFGSDQRPPARAEVRTSVTTSAAPGADPSAPWASDINDSTPLVKYVSEHPSPAGQQAVDALKAQKAVVLVGLAKGGTTDPKLLSWIDASSRYCRALGVRIDVDPADPQVKELLDSVQAGDLEAPFLVGIGLDGAVKQKVGGQLTQKQVIAVFAEVTGSCGIECENGQCE